MAQNFVLNDFVRHVDPTLLKAYLAGYNILLPSPRTEIDHQQHEVILLLLHALPIKRLSAIESDLRQVNELSTYSGRIILRDLAQMRQVHLPDVFAQMTQYDTALWFFLYEPTLFIQARQDYEAEDIVGWREFLVPKISHQHLRKHTHALQAALQAYLLTQEQRGQNCIVEYHKKGKTIHYVAYPEDYAKVKVVYTKPQQLDRRICRPVQRIYFRYDTSTRVLGIKGFRSLRKLEAYREIFCQTVLRYPVTDSTHYECHLALLTDPGFALVYGPDVEQVVITSVTVTLPHRARNITLDFAAEAPTTIDDLHRQLLQHNLPLDHVTILRVKFCFKFKSSTAGHERTSVTCYLASPNTHNLADTPLHQRVITYFKQWGLYRLAGYETPTQPPQS